MLSWPFHYSANRATHRYDIHKSINIGQASYDFILVFFFYLIYFKNHNATTSGHSKNQTLRNNASRTVTTHILNWVQVDFKVVSFTRCNLLLLKIYTWRPIWLSSDEHATVTRSCNFQQLRYSASSLKWRRRATNSFFKKQKQCNLFPTRQSTHVSRWLRSYTCGFVLTYEEGLTFLQSQGTDSPRAGTANVNLMPRRRMLIWDKRPGP